MKQNRSHRLEAGLVLLASLLILLLIGLLASTLAGTGLIQMRMAANDEAALVARQRAQAAIESTLADVVASSMEGIGGMEGMEGMVGMEGDVGYLLCMQTSPRPDCDAHSIVLSADVTPAKGHMDVTVERMAPRVSRMPAMAESAASSAVHYRVQKIEIRAVYDGKATGSGRADLAQGLLLRVPASQLVTEVNR